MSVVSWSDFLTRGLFGAPQLASERFVVSIRVTGMGDRLASLAAAWRFARNTDRTLIADWRLGGISADPATNAFSQCFEAPDTLAGVRLIGDRHVPAATLPQPRYPHAWGADTLLELPLLRKNADVHRDRLKAVRIIRRGRDLPANTVVFDGCINDGIVALSEARTFFDPIRPSPKIAKAVADFRRDRLAGGPVIGIHIRHGNGGNVLGHAPYWNSIPAAIARCKRAAGEAKSRLGGDPKVFLCTDSREIETAFAAVVPDVIVRPKSYRANGEGELHAGVNAWQRRDDAVTEMILLSACDRLVRYPPGSFFSLYGAVKIASNVDPKATLYDLQRPWERSDPLAPAIV
jgi:hypothetical protein